jgi:hypothetical protein
MNYLNILKFLLVCAIVIAALVATSAEPASLQSNSRVVIGCFVAEITGAGRSIGMSL